MLVRFALLVFFAFIVDLLSIKLIVSSFSIWRQKQKRLLFLFLLGLSALLGLSFFVYILFSGTPKLDYIKLRVYFDFFSIFLLLFLPKFIIAFFLLIEVLLRFVFRLVRNRNVSFPFWRYFGLLLGTIMFLFVLHGIFIGKTHYVVKHITIVSEKIPKSFNGYSIVQFSDFHLGSFRDKNQVKKCLHLLNAQKAQLVVFTGDLINVSANEAQGYLEIFKNIQAPYGKYAILGNHDLDDYAKWDAVDMKEYNQKELRKFYKYSGFILLEDSSVYIVKDNDTLILAGVLNWGLPPFKKSGNLNKAMKFTKGKHTTILLSHDPTHWESEILNHSKILLTLSGHTHGGQIGLKTKYFGISPSQFIYMYWNGLYSKNGQYLYVNPGTGYIGFSGRVGIWPEITVITLQSKQ